MLLNLNMNAMGYKKSGIFVFFVDIRPVHDAANFRIEASSVARFIVCIEKKVSHYGLVFRLGKYPTRLVKLIIKKGSNTFTKMSNVHKSFNLSESSD